MSAKWVLTEKTRQLWQIHYRQRQQQRLRLLKERLATEPVQSVAAHLSSIVVLLDHCQAVAALHPQIAEVIDLLHPWPLRWGAWHDWERQLQFAARQYKEADNHAHYLQYQTHIARLFFKMGRLQEAVSLCREITQTALERQLLIHLAIATEIYALALIALGRNGEATILLDNCEKLVADLFSAETSPKTKAITQAYLTWPRINLLRWDGKAQAAIDLGAQLTNELAHYPDIDAEIVAHSHHGYGVALWAIGHYEASLQHITIAHDLFVQIGDKVESYVMRDNIGMVYWSMGQLDKAEQAMQESLRLMRNINAQWHVVRLVGDVAVVYMANGEVGKALEYITEHKQLAMQAGDEHEIYRADGNHATMLLCRRLYAEVIPLKQQQLATEQQHQLLVPQVVTLIELSTAYHGLGELQKAASYAQQAWNLNKQVDSATTHIFTLRNLAKYRLAEQSFAMLQEAAQLAQKHKRRLDVAACHFDTIEFIKSEAERENLWRSACDLLTAMNAQAWLRQRSIAHPPHLPYLL